MKNFENYLIDVPLPKNKRILRKRLDEYCEEQYRDYLMFGTPCCSKCPLKENKLCYSQAYFHNTSITTIRKELAKLGDDIVVKYNLK